MRQPHAAKGLSAAQPSTGIPGRTRGAIVRERRRQLLGGTAIAARFALGFAAAIGIPAAAAAGEATLPTGGRVASGDATISSSGPAGLLVTQSTDTAIINWDGFSIGGEAAAHFANGSGATLNRVTGNLPSSIDGMLTATGSLFLVNPAGIAVGTGGMVATGGSFVGSTQDVSDADFLGGGAMTFSGSSRAGIVNHGTISSAMGDVALIARRVENTGDISAPNGTAALLAGYEVLMREASGANGRFAVQIGGPDTEVVNSGAIRAAEAELRANGGNVLALAGNTRGVVKATGVARSGGRIFLTAGGGKVVSSGRVAAQRRAAAGGAGQQGGEVFINADTVLASGDIDVSGLGLQGGSIDIGGRDIALQGATLDASGDTGGGRIRVGGEYQGGKGLVADEVENAETLLIDAASSLMADGTGDGVDGGTVIAWADGHAGFEGFISAAAFGSGHGGFIETSGKETIDFSGQVNAASATGQSGKWLIDPGSFDLNSAFAGFLAGVLGSGTDVDIVTFLGTIPDTVTTSAALTVNFAGGPADDVATLTVTAGDTITVSNAVTALNGVLNLDLNADNGLIIGAAIDTNGGNVGIRTDALALNSTIDAGSGTVTIAPVSSGHDIDIGGADAAGTLGLTNTEINAITAGALLIGTTANGDIAVSSDIGLNSAMTLALAARGNITADASIQNDGSGDVALIAGWDGVTTNPASFLSANLATQTLFGNGGGSVFIGDGTQGSSIGVSSRFGTTAVFADNLTITGGDSADTHAQLGYFTAAANGTADGDIHVALTADLAINAGGAESSYAQIGHGSGDNALHNPNAASYQGDITIAATNITLQGNAFAAPAQIGHGGMGSEGSQIGDISVTASGDIGLTGGGGSFSYALIGNGGASTGSNSSNALISGKVTVDAQGDIALSAGSANAAFAEIGHSGYLHTNGDLTGDVEVTVGGDLGLVSGDAGSARYAQIGNGSANLLFGSASGAVTVSVAGETILATRTAGTFNFTMIGTGKTGNGFATIGTGASLTPTGGLTMLALQSVVMNPGVTVGAGAAANLIGGWDGTTGLDLTGFPVFTLADVVNGGTFGAADGDVKVNGTFFASGATFVGAEDATFASTVDGAMDLTVNATGNAVFSGKVGGTTLLSSLTADTGGTAAITGLVATTGDQRFDSQVTDNGTVFVSTGGSLDFNAGVTPADPSKDVWFLAADDITIGGDIQWNGSGSVTLVAGWNAATDGSTGWTLGGTTADTPTLVTAGNYGLGTGDILISDGTGAVPVAVGSSGAATTALARDLVLHGGNIAGASSQLGFRGAATGDIDVMLTRDLMGQAGSNSATYVQVGHGGYDQNQDHSGNITIEAAGDVTFTAGNVFATYAQLGHGGYVADGNNSGAIVVSADGLTFTGGGADSTYAQLGHGGRAGNGSHSGSITITAVNDLAFTGGSGIVSSAQLGHGGFFADDAHSGAITIVSANNLAFTGGSGIFSYAQLGHGGAFASGNHSGAISLNLTGGLSLIGGSDPDAYSQIGHGDASGNASGTRMGDISAIVGGITAFTDETGGAWFGHATTTGDGVSNADVALVTNGLNTTGIPLVTTGLADFAGMLQYDLLGGNVLIANRIAAATPDAGGFANQGFDDIIFTGPNSGRFTSSNELTLAAGGDVVMLSSVQNQGDGGVNLIGGWDGATGLDLSAFPMLDPDAVEAASAFGVTGGDVYIGDGSQTQDVRVGSRQGDIHVLAHDLEVRGSFVSSSDEARLGYRTGPVPGINSDIRIAVTDDVIVEGGTEDFTRAAIGHDNVESNGEIHGDITILGDTANDNVLAVLGGSGNGAYAQIGHEGCCAPIFGNIMIAGEDVVVQGGTNIFTDAQIGHYWDEATGNITINASGLFDVIGGDAPATYATVGHIGGDSLTGDINITVGLDSFISGGGVFESDAQVGHYGEGQNSVVNGAINFSVLGNLDIWAGFDEDTPAFIGHAGIGGSATGDIEVDVGGTLTLWSSDFEDAWTQIGHSINDGANSGQIDVNAGVLDLLAGDDPEAFAQIGHGDAAIDHSGTRQGDINVVVTGEATLEDNVSGLAWIGHGTTTPGGITNANVFLQAFGFDRDSGSTVAPGGLGLFNKDILEADIVGGNFTVIATGTGLLVEDPVYNSPHTVTMAVNNDLVLDTNAMFVNSGTGDIILAAGGDFHNDTGSLTPFTTGGRWLVYSTRPDNNRNDLEITNWDFLRYSTAFDINNPLVGTGNGLVYSVTPVVNFAVSDETIPFGQLPTPTLSQILTVNGAAADPLAFGLGVNPVLYGVGLAASVPVDAAGNAPIGFHAGGLTVQGVVLPYFGMLYTATPGDLTVTGSGSSEPPVRLSADACRFVQIELDAEEDDEETPEEDPVSLCGILESVTP